ncbi:MAG: tRNA lysidine(34) synthetase TilS [Anaerolineae bacterium]|nr:tRNA lysidine(34) synthetase TilS [Anaerolineae bacterium]
MNECALAEDEKIVVGVSGGPDSLCLLDLLAQVKWPVIVAHYDHHLRAESGADAEMVQAAATAYGLPFVLGQGDVAGYARQQRASVEEAARECRYRFLFETASAWQAKAVLVAHNADDQVETVIMHLIRGSGLAGLKGMCYRSILPEWHACIPLLRPLLSYWREDIINYCKDRKLTPVLDASNNDITYFRNRLRHELIPYLGEYNPQIKKGLWRMAFSLGGDFDLIQGMTQQAALRVLQDIREESVALNYAELCKLTPGLQRNILRFAIQKLRPALRDINFDAIERALVFIRKPSRQHQMDLVDGLWLVLSGEKLFIGDPKTELLTDGFPACADISPAVLPLEGVFQLDNHWQISVELIKTDDPMGMINHDPNQAYLDMTALNETLIVRTWTAGDRFSPLGMKGHIKLSDLFINQRVPEQARKKYPLVCSGDKIIWIPGLRVAREAAVNKDTKFMLHLTLSQAQPQQ